MDNSISKKAILDQLGLILGSDQFAGAFRIKKLLEFIVKEYVSGRENQIKAYTIGLSVFNREADFDPQIDPIVRINIARLRRHLTNYYEKSDYNDVVRISIPKGTCIPNFQSLHTSKLQLTTRQRESVPSDSSEIALNVKHRLGHAEPVIAVLPFAGIDVGESQAIFLDGLPDELSSRLAVFQDLRVIDYYSTAQLRNTPFGIVEIGRQLGADFLISGSMTTANNSMKIRVSLSEARTGIQIWSHVFHRPISAKEISGTLKEITERIIGAVAGDYGAICREWQKAFSSQFHEDLSHYDVVFLHRQAQFTGNHITDSKNIEAIEHVVEKDPRFALGWAILGEIYCDLSTIFQYDPSRKLVDKGYSYAKKATYIDQRCQFAHYVLAYAYLLKKDPQKVKKALEKVVHLNPNSAFLVGATAFWLCLAGYFEKGLRILKHSITLNPYYPRWFHHASFLYNLKQGDYARAMEEAERFHIPDFFWSYLDKAVAAGLLGKTDAAKAMLKKTIELHPDFASHPHYYVSAFVIEDDLMEKMQEGLKVAGLRIG